MKRPKRLSGGTIFSILFGLSFLFYYS